MAKTLVDFRAEQGLYLKDLATVLEMSEDELRIIEESGTVPEELGQRLILEYALPEDYFSAPILTEQNTKETPKSPTRYFLKVSVVYYLLSALVASVPMYIYTIGSMIMSFVSFAIDKEFEPFSTSSPLFSVFNSIWLLAVEIIGCILFANYILKHTTYTGDIKKYQFLHNPVPSGAIAFISVLMGFITTFSFKAEGGATTTYFIWQSINLVVSLVGVVLTIFIHMQLLKTAIEEDVVKKQKTLKTFAIIITVSSVLSFVLTIISAILLNESATFVIIRRFFVYGLYIAVAWAVALVNPDDEKKCKIAYTILPLVSICQSVVFSIIGVFI